MGNSGIFGYIEYGKQTNFSTALAAGAATRSFGMDQKVTSFSVNNNRLDLGDLNSVSIQKFAFGQFEGSLGVEAVLSDPWAMDMWGTTVTTGAGPYTHTTDDSKTVNAYTTELGFDAETTDRVLQLQKCTLNSMTISAALNETVKIKYDMTIGATPTTAGTALDASITTDGIQFPYTYVTSKLENPSGTALAEVTSFEFTINPNIRHQKEPNSRDSVSAYKGRLDLGGRFSLAVKDNTWFNNVMARAEPANNTLKMIFTNALAGVSERSIAYTFTGLGLGTLNMPIDQYELVTDEVPFTARDLTAVAVNNTSAVP